MLDTTMQLFLLVKNARCGQETDNCHLMFIFGREKFMILH